MAKRRTRVLRLVGALAVVMSTFGAGSASAQTPQSANLINNPSFEEGMYHTSMSNFIADGWAYWYQGRAADDPRGNWMPEPEYGLIADRVGQAHSGHKSQRWFNTWAIHNAGIYQRVKVPADSWTRFSIWMFNWSSQEDVFGVSEAFHHKWVGIDPTGGTDAFSPNVIWGNEDRTMDVWVQIGVIAKAQGEYVTVFVREQPEYPVKHNDVLLDDAELYVIPAPAGGVVVQPVSAATRSAVKADNTTAEKALEISRTATQATIPGGTGDTKYSYFKFQYPGGDNTPYKINVLTAQDDAATSGKFGFRVYGPRAGNVYVTSGGQRGLNPNVTGDLLIGEPGWYVVQVYNSGPTAVDYRIWLTGKGIIGEVAADEPTPVAAPAANAPTLPAAPGAPAVLPPPLVAPGAPVAAPALPPIAAPDAPPSDAPAVRQG